MLGFDVQGEVSTDKGRIDAAWKWEDRIVVAEVKFAANGKVEPLLDAAVTQIRESRYYDRYIGEGRQVTLLALGLVGKTVACRAVELP
jgi:hypothetical protein